MLQCSQDVSYIYSRYNTEQCVVFTGLGRGPLYVRSQSSGSASVSCKLLLKSCTNFSLLILINCVIDKQIQHLITLTYGVHILFLLGHICAVCLIFISTVFQLQIYFHCSFKKLIQDYFTLYVISVSVYSYNLSLKQSQE